MLEAMCFTGEKVWERQRLEFHQVLLLFKEGLEGEVFRLKLAARKNTQIFDCKWFKMC